MKSSWLKSVLPIAAIFSLRMLGLFMLIPVFSVLATQLRGATPTLIGIALGSYGLSQGIFQMPFGMLSDRFGRKSILILGLSLFICGSIIGAYSDSIYTMIIARILQGAGAIGSVLIALLADLTADEERTKAMAAIGVTIGLSFSLAMVISPAITHYYGLAGIFYLATFLAFAGLLVVIMIIPTPVKESFHLDSEARTSLFKVVLQNKHLQQLNMGIFLQHFILTATFYAIPIILLEQMRAGNLTNQWSFYLIIMLLSFVCMVPFIAWAEKKERVKTVFSGGVLITAAAQFLLTFSYHHWTALCVLMFFYFVAFNVLEALLPSLVSKQAAPNAKGTAMGVYSTSQFLGIFFGGAAAGIVYQYITKEGVFLLNSILAFAWLIVAAFMRPNTYLLTLIISYPATVYEGSKLLQRLNELKGVKNAIIAHKEKVIYLRVDKRIYQPGSAEKILANFSN